jgi:hypothetical protein
MKLFWVISVSFDITDQLLKAFLHLSDIRKNGSTSGIRRPQESLWFSWEGSIAQYSRVPMKPVRLIKMCLNETHNKVRAGKQLSDTFPIQGGLLFINVKI